MLCAIRQRDRQRIAAWDQEKSDGPFYCPVCVEETILKKGTMKVHHFAHKPPIRCEYGKVKLSDTASASSNILRFDLDEIIAWTKAGNSKMTT